MYNEEYLAHYGVKGMKWGVRRYQNKDGSYTNTGKKRMSRAEKDVKKLVDVSTKYYDNVNQYNALKDTGGIIDKKFEKMIEANRRATQKLVNKLDKKYASVNVTPTFEKNGYVVKSTEVAIASLDKLGRISSINKSYTPIETYNSWRQMDKIDSKYRKKIASAKTEEERKLLELEWMEEMNELE